MKCACAPISKLINLQDDAFAFCNIILGRTGTFSFEAYSLVLIYPYVLYTGLQVSALIPNPLASLQDRPIIQMKRSLKDL